MQTKSVDGRQRRRREEEMEQRRESDEALLINPWNETPLCTEREPSSSVVNVDRGLNLEQNICCEPNQDHVTENLPGIYRDRQKGVAVC